MKSASIIAASRVTGLMARRTRASTSALETTNALETNVQTNRVRNCSMRVGTTYIGWDPYASDGFRRTFVFEFVFRFICVRSSTGLYL